jgi:hypothetical protein
VRGTVLAEARLDAVSVWSATFTRLERRRSVYRVASGPRGRMLARAHREAWGVEGLCSSISVS